VEVRLRFRTSRVGTRLGTVIVLAAAIVAMAVPAGAAGAPVSIASSATPVAVGADLSIDKVQVRNNTAAAVAAVDVRFELVPASPAPWWPFSFDSYQSDSACHLDGQVLPSYAVVCHYGVQVAAGTTAGIAVRLRLSPGTDSATAPSPLLKITVGTGADADTTTVGPIVRVKRVADLAVRLASQPKGRVGGIVDLQWIVTNKGPDTVPNVGLILTAPPGTEWTGAVAAQCNPPAIPKTKYRCISGEPLPPGGGRILTETWQLKIDSAAVGTGQITAIYNLNGGSPDPYLDITDPNTADNTVNFTVGIDTGTAGATGAPAPGGAPHTAAAGGAPADNATTATATAAATPGPAASDATPSPDTETGVNPAASATSRTPAASAALVRTSSNGVLLGAVGSIVLIAGALLGLVAYRRRPRTATTPD